MSPASPTPIVMQVRGQRIGACEQLGRNAARTVAQGQGFAIDAHAQVSEITEHLGIQQMADSQADPVRRSIWRLLGRIAATAKLERARETHALACEVVGLLAPYEAHEIHEGIRHAILRRHAHGAADSIRQVIRTQESLLTCQQEPA